MTYHRDTRAITCFGAAAYGCGEGLRDLGPWAGALGRIEPWGNAAGHVWERDDIYCYRFTALDISLQEPRDALLFVKAAGALFGRDFDLDTCAIAVNPGSGGETLIDVIMRRAIPGLITTPLSRVSQYPDEIKRHPEIAQRWPELQITPVAFGLLKDAPQAVKHWLAQPLLWDHRVAQGRGGVTNTYLQPHDFSVVYGSAEDGQRATPWVAKPTPVTPPVPPNPPPPGGGAGTILIAVAIVGLLFAFSSNDRGSA